MTNPDDVARAFFEACETGQGWAGCAPYAMDGATFASQAEPIADITTLEGYADWMKGLLSFVEDGRYELQSWATDAERGHVVAFAKFLGTHSGEGGPMPPTGKATVSDYVYVMDMVGGKVAHVTKIWNAPWAMRELGWID